MNYWTLYDFIVNNIHVYMGVNNQCLYNALVLVMANMKKEELLNVRNSAYVLIQMIEEEIQQQESDENDNAE